MLQNICMHGSCVVLWTLATFIDDPELVEDTGTNRTSTAWSKKGSQVWKGSAMKLQPGHIQTSMGKETSKGKYSALITVCTCQKVRRNNTELFHYKCGIIFMEIDIFNLANGQTIQRVRPRSRTVSIREYLKKKIQSSVCS